MSRGMSSVGDILESFLKKRGYDGDCKEWEVVSAWKRIVGEPIAKVTECDRAVSGVLYVKVTTAAWRQDLTYLKDELKEAIRRETGCETIRDIVFH